MFNYLLTSLGVHVFNRPPQTEALRGCGTRIYKIWPGKHPPGKLPQAETYRQEKVPFLKRPTVTSNLRAPWADGITEILKQHRGHNLPLLSVSFELTRSLGKH